MSPSLLPPGILRLPQSDPCGSATPSCLAVSSWRVSSTSLSWLSSWSKTSLASSSWGPLLGLGSLGRGLAFTPTLDKPLIANGVTSPCSSVVPYLHTHQEPDVGHNGLTTPSYDHSKMMHCYLRGTL